MSWSDKGQGIIGAVTTMKSKRAMLSVVLGGLLVICSLPGCVPFLELIGLGQPGEGGSEYPHDLS